MPISYKHKIYTTNGWLTSYKRKLYMGRSIEWNQLFDKSKYPATTTTNGVTFTNNGDGTIIVNGTCELSAGYVGLYLYGHPRPEEGEKIGHKYGVFGCPSGGSNSTYRINASIRNSDGSYSGGFSDTGGGNISKSAIIEGQYILCEIAIYAGYTANSLIFKPQLFDLTQMFGAGNEPTTPEEFWFYFDHKLYPYNTGETQPLFKISRKSQWGSATTDSLYVGEDIIIPQIVRN